MTAGNRGLLRLISASILALGLAGAGVIYMTASDEPAAAVSYELINGVVQPIPASESKSYQRDLRLYGGTMAVLADELGTWFSGLWRGRKLAFTLAALSIALSVAIHLLSKQLPPGPDAGVRDETDSEFRG